jgi:hypothetical protein
VSERIVRPSSLADFSDCSRRWAARHLRSDLAAAGYELQPPGPSHVGALVGTGVHYGAAYTLSGMTGSGALPRIADAQEAAIVGFRERMEVEGVTWDEVTDKPNTAERQIQRMTRSYCVEVAPQIRPLLVEERVEAEVFPGWIISGQADNLGTLVLDVENAGEVAAAGLVLRDLKTGRVKRHHGPQLAVYSMLFAAHGHDVQSALVDFIPRVALKKEQPPAEEHPIDLVTARQDAWSLLRSISRDVAEFEARVANPSGEDPRGAFLANPASSLCSVRFCPAHGTRWCSSHRR